MSPDDLSNQTTTRHSPHSPTAPIPTPITCPRNFLPRFPTHSFMHPLSGKICQNDIEIYEVQHMQRIKKKTMTFHGSISLLVNLMEMTKIPQLKFTLLIKKRIHYRPFGAFDLFYLLLLSLLPLVGGFFILYFYFCGQGMTAKIRGK